MINIKTPKEIEVMAEGGRRLAEILVLMKKEVRAGITTKELDLFAERKIIECGGQPSFKLPVAQGGGGFLATSCVSINDEVVHGVPSNRKIKEGDLVTLDIGMVYQGFHTDTAITVPAGEIAPEAHRLLRVGKKSLKYAIKKSRAGNTVGDIGNTIERYVESQGYHVIDELCGHGIGRTLHEDPQIMNYGKRHKGALIKVGMVFCPEPMITPGDPDIVIDQNGLTWRIKDGSLSVHFEHTIAIFPDGAHVLTKAADESEEPADQADSGEEGLD